MEIQNPIYLRPHTLLELFDQAIRLFRNHFLKFIGIVAVVLVPVQILQLLANYLAVWVIANATGVNNFYTLNYPLYANGLIKSTVNFFISMIEILLINGIANAALTNAIMAIYMGEDISIGKAYSRIRKSWGSILVSLLLLGVITVVGIIWSVVPCIGWVTGPGALAFIALVMMPLIAPIITIEKQTGLQAIRRAWELVRKRFWWLMGFFILILLFNFLVIQGPVQVVSQVVQGPISAIISVTQHIPFSLLPLLVNSISGLLLSLLSIPLQSTCATLVYFDLRVRQEGLDIAMMANQSSDTPLQSLEELIAQPSETAARPLITWPDVGNFAGFTLAALALLGALYAILFGIATILIPAID